MLTESLKNQIKSIYNSMVSKGRKPRLSQKIMIAEIAKTIFSDEGKILVAEAPTGTGKSLAYLTGALPSALAAEKKLIITTSTVVLQEQIAQKDLPYFLAESGLNVKAVVAKGRGRYACLVHLAKKAGYASKQADMFAGAFGDPMEGAESLKAMSDALESGAWDGDRDSLKFPVSDKDWASVTMDSASCPGKVCRFRSECPFAQARLKVLDADIVIANHDLLLSDLQLGGGIILPKVDESVVVIDEAHALPLSAANHFGNRIALKEVFSTLVDVAPMASRFDSLPGSKRRGKFASEIAIQLSDALMEFEHLVKRGFPKEAVDASKSSDTLTLRFKSGKVVDDVKYASGLCGGMIEELKSYFISEIELAKGCLKNGKAEQSVVESILIDSGNLLSVLQNAHATFAAFADASDDNALAKWIEINFGKHVALEYRPVDSSGLLHKNLWSRAFSVILTSATLTALGRFEHFRKNAGLPREPEAVYIKLASPFDYSRASLRIPGDKNADPSFPQNHLEYLKKVIPNLIRSDDGVLVLFTSWKQMQAVREVLPDELRQVVLSQGDAPRSQILIEHKRRIESGLPSVIFGLSSFAEGVDLPGRQCRHVIIAKLPFAPPGGPIEATIAELVSARGGSVFHERVLPSASIKLVQSVGRLIRTETDEGEISILDARLKTKTYGKRLLAALPSELSIVA